MRIASLMLLLALVVPSFAQSDHNANIAIYTDNTSSLWKVRGDADIDVEASERARTGLYSIRTMLEPNQEIEFFQHWEGVSTAGFTHFELWINPGSQSGTNFSVRAVCQGNTGPTVMLSNYATLVPNTWTRVRIPLADLGAANQTSFKQIFFRSTGVGTRTVWIDDVRLAKPAPTTAAINVNSNTVIRTLNDRMFGVATFAWDGDLLHPSTRSRVIEAGITMLSFPGGRLSNEYDWLNSRNRRTGGNLHINTQKFIDFANSVGAEKVITVNYGSGTPQEARDWVQHANVTLGGNVKYWNIGNEPYQGHFDLHPFEADALTYAEFAAQCMQLMRAVDPSIKIGVSAAIGEHSFPQRVFVINPRTGQPANGWNAVMLSRLMELNAHPDYIDFHFYPNSPGTETDHFTLQAAKRWDFLYPFQRQTLQDYMGAAGATIPIYILENNSTWGKKGKQSLSMVNAIYLMDSWARSTMLGGDAFVWWNLHNDANLDGNNNILLHGWRNFGEYGILSLGLPAGVSPPLNTPYPTFYAFKLLKYFARPGDKLVAAQSNNDLLAVYAAKQAGTNKIRLLVLNKSHDTAFTVFFTFNGFRPGLVGTIRRYGMEQDLAGADVATFFQRGGAPASFPPYSMTVLEY